MEFVGLQLMCGGYKPLKRNTDPISNFPVPDSVGQLQRFLGMINFYRQFISGMAEIARPLYALTKKGI